MTAILTAADNRTSLRDGRSAWLRFDEVGTTWRCEAVDDRGHVVAHACLAARPGGSRMDAELCVAPDWRGAGLGTHLFALTLEQASNGGASWIAYQARTDDAAAKRMVEAAGLIAARRVEGPEAEILVMVPSRSGAARES